MAVIFRVLGWLLAAIAAVVLGALFWIDDPNRLKPELEDLIETYTNFTVTFNGDLAWQLFPPLVLEMQNVSITDGDTTVDAARVDLNLDLSGLWQSIDEWRIQELSLVSATVTTRDSESHIKTLALEDFAFREPAPLSVSGSYNSNTENPVPFELTSLVTYIPVSPDQTEHINLEDLAFTSNEAAGICQIDLRENPSAPAELPVQGPDAILPIDTLLTYDIMADCTLDRLNLGTETFNEAYVDLTNVGGKINSHLRVDDFLGGKLVTDLDIDVTQKEPTWTVAPDISDVDSKRLLNWTDQRLGLIAPLALNSKLVMRGNTQASLVQSIRATSEFDGGQGEINITKIKEQLARIAVLTRRSEQVERWPDMWQYKHFTGRWKTEGANQELRFALDNMNVDAEGTYDYLNDSIDMLAEVTILETTEDSPFKINETLQGTPIPIRCRGLASDPKCRLDEHAARNLIAGALRNDNESGLRQKLEKKIDEEVPEEYRDAARDLLDLIGRALENR